MGSQFEYFYESQIGADNKNPFAQSNIDNLNYISRYDNNDNQEDIIPIANQFDWQDNGFQSGHEYEYEKSADHEYQYPEAKRDSISIYETDRDNKNQALIANQNLMLEDRATTGYKYQYEKNLENFNKIIELENTKSRN